MIMKNGAKMSKTKGNVINPDIYIEKYSADVFGTHLMFFGNFKEGGDFRDRGIAGIERFMSKLWHYCHSREFIPGEIRERDLRIILNMKIKQVTEDIEKLDYNTAIAGNITIKKRYGSYYNSSLPLLPLLPTNSGNNPAKKR
jgi:leucyl-tRNA synthetase